MSAATAEPLDVTKICRVCLQEKTTMSSIYEKEIEFMDYSWEHRKKFYLCDILNECTNVKPNPNDELPTQMCRDCVQIAQISFRFKRKTEKSQQLLLSQLQSRFVVKQEPLDENSENNEFVINNCKDCGENLSTNKLLLPNIMLSMGQCPVCQVRGHMMTHLKMLNPSNSANVTKMEANVNQSPMISINAAQLSSVHKHENGLLLKKGFLRTALPKLTAATAAACKQEQPSRSAQSSTLKKNSAYITNDSHVRKVAYQCPICGQGFTMSSILQHHMANMHKIQQVASIDQQAAATTMHVDNNSTNYTDVDQMKEEQLNFENNAVFAVKSELSDEDREDNALSDVSLEFKGFDEDDFKVDLFEKYNEQQKAVINGNDRHAGFRINVKRKKRTIGRKFSSSKEEHSNSHECKICQRVFAVPLYLKRHLLNVHGARAEGSKEHKCKKCNISFERWREWNRHNEIVHAIIERIHKCKYCSKSFPRPSQLEVHERYHTGEKQFVCSTCGKEFHNMQNLNKHCKNVHSDDKHYKCNHCLKRFAHNYKLQRHLKTHTGLNRIKCSECEASFLEPYGLRQHALKFHKIEMEFQNRKLEVFPRALTQSSSKLLAAEQC